MSIIENQKPITSVVPGQSSAGSVIYVGPSETGNHSGTDANDAMTIQDLKKAYPNGIPNGTTIELLSGTYTDQLILNNANNVTITAAPGQTPVFNCANMSLPETTFSDTSSAPGGVIQIENSSNITVSGITIIGMSSQKFFAGISVFGQGDNITLTGNQIGEKDSPFGRGSTVEKNKNESALAIAVYGTSATALTNINIANNNITNTHTGQSETVTLNGNVDGFTVEGNHITDCDNIGIDVIGGEGTAPSAAVDCARNGQIFNNFISGIHSNNNPSYTLDDNSADGIYVDGGGAELTNDSHGNGGITISGNQISDVDLGIEAASEHKGLNSTNVDITGNTISNVLSAGISIGGWNNGSSKGGQQPAGSSKDCIIENNTLNDADIQLQYFGQGATGNMIKGNTINMDAKDQEGVSYNDDGSVESQDGEIYINSVGNSPVPSSNVYIYDGNSGANSNTFNDADGKGHFSANGTDYTGATATAFANFNNYMNGGVTPPPPPPTNPYLQQIQNDLAAAKSEITDLNNQISALQGDIASDQQQIASLNTQITNLQNEINALSKTDPRYAQATADMKTLTAARDQLVSDLGASAGKIQTLNQKIASLNTDLKNLGVLTNPTKANANQADADVNSLKGIGTDISTDKTAYANELKAVTDDISTVTQDLATPTNPYLQPIQNDLAVAKAEIDNLNNQISSLQSNIASDQQQIASLNAQITNLQNEINALSKTDPEYAQATADMKTLTAARDQLVSDLGASAGKIQTLNQKIASLNTDLKNLGVLTNPTKANADQADADVNSLKGVGTDISAANTLYAKDLQAVTAGITTVTNDLSSVTPPSTQIPQPDLSGDHLSRETERRIRRAVDKLNSLLNDRENDYGDDDAVGEQLTLDRKIQEAYNNLKEDLSESDDPNLPPVLSTILGEISQPIQGILQNQDLKSFESSLSPAGVQLVEAIAKKAQKDGISYIKAAHKIFDSSKFWKNYGNNISSDELQTIADSFDSDVPDQDDDDSLSSGVRALAFSV